MDDDLRARERLDGRIALAQIELGRPRHRNLSTDALQQPDCGLAEKASAAGDDNALAVPI
jgi:hypothetical protein